MGAAAAGAEWRIPVIEDISVLNTHEINAANTTLGVPPQALQADEEKYSRPTSRQREPSSKALENIANTHSLLSIKDNIEVFPVRDPNTVSEALNSPYREQWERAMDEEMAEIWKQEVFTIVKCPPGVKPIGSRWVFKIKWKHNPKAKTSSKAYEIERFKARWVATGYNQRKGIDYKESYAFVIQSDSMRILICIRTAFIKVMSSIDFTNFYLQGVLADAGEEPFYAKQPQHYAVKGKEEWVCKVTKGLYGYPPSGRVAQLRLTKILNDDCKMSQNATDPMLFRNASGSVHCGYHVDDGIFLSDKLSDIHDLAKTLASKGMKGPVIENPTKFIGTQFEYLEDNIILCHQESHTVKLLSQTGYINANHVDTPMAENARRPDDEEFFEAEGITEFQEICGNIIWLLRTRYDLAFATQQICMKMSCPRDFDLQNARRIMRYLNATRRTGLIYRPIPANAVLETYAYCDAAFKEERPHVGVAVFLGVPDPINHINKSAAVSVTSKQIKTTCLDTMHAELIGIALAIKHCQYVTDVRNEMGYTQTTPSIIFCDNRPAINFLKGDTAIPSKSSRHLRRRYAYIREAMAHRRIELVWVSTHLNCSDALTKALGRVKLVRHSMNMMGQL